MTEVSFRITHPSTGELLKGRITLTPRHTRPGRPITDSGAVVSGSPIVVELSGEPVTIDLRGSGPDWRYDVVGQDESGWRFSESVRVPMRLPGGTESIDYGNLERVDPRAGGIPFTPDPAWWAVAREIQSLGGIPGESFKAAMERHYQRSLTDAELANLMRGAKGDPGDPGRDGETYLDYFRQEVDNPSATREDYHEWIRGRDAVEQWAAFVGLHPEDVTVEDMLEAQKGKDSFEEWRLREDRPDATWDDYVEAFTGPKGEDSTVPGPRGERGASFMDALRVTDPEVTEGQVYGHVMGGSPEWEVPSLVNGWEHADGGEFRLRELDGMIEVAGSLALGRNIGWRVCYLPTFAIPEDTILVASDANQGRNVRFEFRGSGEVFVTSADQGSGPTRFYFSTAFASPSGTVRPRIPGPAGLSAVELLQQDGLDLPAAEITRRLRVLVEGVE